MPLTRAEQETVIVFTEADTTIDFYTHNEKLKRKLHSYVAECPEYGNFVSENSEGGASFKIDRKRVSFLFNKPSTRVYTEEEKQALRDRLAKYRKAKAIETDDEEGI